MPAKTFNWYPRKRLVTAISIVLVGGSFSAHSQPVYIITDLGALGGVSSSGYGINSTGDVTGVIWYQNESSDAFVYSNGVTESLGTASSIGSSINDNGQIVGTTDTDQIVIYDYSGLIQQDLGVTGSSDSDINNLGHVTGEAYTNGSYAFYYDGNSVQPIGALGGTYYSAGSGINSSDQITGWYDTGSDSINAFLFPPNTGTPPLGIEDVAPPDSIGSYGTSINDKGEIVGYFYDASYQTNAFFRSSTGDYTVLGPGRAYGVNESGQVVGGGSQAFLYSGNQLLDLNTLLASGSSNWLLGYAYAINDNGQVTGQGLNTLLNEDHAFLATPSGSLNWIGSGSGSWESTDNWELGFLPNRFLDVVIASNVGDITVTGPIADSTVKSLTVGGGESAATLDINGGGNVTVLEGILVDGSNGNDGILHSTGTTVASSLTLGQNSGNSGSYSLSGNGVLTITDPNATSSSVQESIGVSGNGTFDQTSGIHVIEQGGMVLAWGAGSSGTYNLSGIDSSLSAVFEVVGKGGTGSFNQTGGTNQVQDLTLGGISQLEVGQIYGSGTYTQSGGIVTVSNELQLGEGSGSTGTYNLSGTGSITANTEVVGNAGNGVFNQSGGSNTVNDTLTLALVADSTGTYNLSGDGVLTATNEYVGHSGTAEFNQTGGTHTVTDNLIIGYNDGSTGTYTQSGGSFTSNGSMELGYFNGAAGTYHLNGGSLYSQDVYVGEYGDGNFSQTGGTHSVNGVLTIALQNGSTGGYDQSGGTLTVTDALEIGSQSSAVGQYDLGGSAVLNVQDESVGVFGTGTFNQTGGTHNVSGTMTINSNSDYQLSAGVLNAATLVNQGNFTQSGGVSTGNLSNESTLNYSGGTFNADLTNIGTVNLSGEGTRVLNGTIINQGTFNINGVIAQINGTLTNDIGGNIAGTEIQNQGTFNYSGGTYDVSTLTNIGTVNLSGQGTRVLGGTINNQGSFNVTDTVAQLTGTFNNQANSGSGGSLAGANILNEGTFNYDGGLVSANLTNTGTVNLNGTGNRIFSGNVSNQGNVNINGAVAQITGTLTNETGGSISGTEIQNQGVFNYSGGTYDVSTLTNTGTVNLSGSDTLVLGGTINNQGSFNVTDTVAQITGMFNNDTGGNVTGGEVINTGTFNYAGGSFNANLTNDGTLNVTGGGTRVLGGSITNQGSVIISDTLAQLTGTFNNVTGGSVSGAQIQNVGTFNYSGGSVNYDQLTNSGTLNVDLGGTAILDKTITNQGQFNIADAIAEFAGTFNNVGDGNVNGGLIVNSGTFNNSGNNFSANLTNTGTVNVSGSGTRTFNGDVTNQGTFNVIETNVVFTGDFDNQGVYFSDPSVNTFNNLNVGPDGYLVGGAGDQFIVQGNFTNSSTQNVNWDTSQSILIFDNPNGPATHQMALASADLGSALTAFDNNFSWGEVVLESGQRLVLVDGNSTPGAALYASQLSLPNGVSQLNSISGDYNIYYDPGIAANQYLAGSVFNFGSGIGQLIPQGFSFLTTDPTAEGFTFNESSYAQALNTACPVATGALAQRCRELRVLTPSQRANAIAASTPTQQLAQVIAPIKFNFARMEAPMLRMAQLRRKHTQASTLSFNGFQLPINLSVAALGLNARGGGAGDEEAFANSFRDEPFGVFIDGKFTVGNQRENPNNFGFDVDSRAVTVGADYRVTDNLVAGAAMEYMNVNTTFDNSAGTMDSDTFMGAVYGSYRLPQDFYVDAIATYGSSEHALTRNFAYPGFAGSASSKPGSEQYTFAITLGKDIAWEEWQISPYTRFEYLQMHVDSYQESGGSGLAVNVGAQSDTSAISSLGTQISYNLSQSWGIVVPSAWVEWEHQYLNDNERIPMRLSAAAAGTGEFVIQTGQPDRDYVNLGGSISASLPEGKSAFIRYEARLGQTDISNNIVEVGVRIPF